MKIKTLQYAAIGLGMVFSLGACSSDKKQKAEGGESSSDCQYVVLLDQAEMTWTGFKTPAKAPVSGQFKEMVVEGDGSGASVAEAFNGASFTLKTNSVSSGDVARDANLRDYFFGTMVNPEEIRGEVQSVEGSGEAGLINVYIHLNGVGAQQPLDFRVMEGYVEVSGTMDLSFWEAIPAVESLNKQCYDLHKGADGESKLWSSVDLMMKVPFQKEGCEN